MYVWDRERERAREEAQRKLCAEYTNIYKLRRTTGCALRALCEGEMFTVCDIFCRRFFGCFPFKYIYIYNYSCNDIFVNRNEILLMLCMYTLIKQTKGSRGTEMRKTSKSKRRARGFSSNQLK